MPPHLLGFQELKTEDDLLEMRASVKRHAADMGFSTLSQTKIVTAASELGRNAIEHGHGGSVRIEHLRELDRDGIRLTFTDDGPGIADARLALSDGYTSKNGMGLGLSGSKRLMDEFELISPPGTTVMVTKWK